MNPRAPRIAIVAGETSGDRLGAALIDSVRARAPTAQFAGMAGPRMRAPGCAAVADIEELSVMGLVEVLRSYPRLRRLRQRIVCHFIAERPDVVVGIEARAFLAGMITAQRLGVGFVAARKPGKLPGQVEGVDYALEYGFDRLEVQVGAISADDRVVIVDDVIATGGTAAAAAALVDRMGGRVAGIRAVLELSALGGRDALAPHPVSSLWEIR